MKTSSKSLKLLSSLVAIAAISAVPAAKAGPGIDYWLGLGKPKQEAAAKATPLPGSLVCTGSRTIPVTEFRNFLANGKGPMSSVQVGIKQVCDVCGATYTSMRPSWPNGKGPLEGVQVKSTHGCNAACAMS